MVRCWAGWNRQLAAMRKLIAALFVFALQAFPAVAQQFPSVPPSTVIGRIGNGQAGPSEAIRFATLTQQLYPVQSANLIYAGPTTGAAAFPTFRALVGADLPVPGASSLGGVKSLACSTSNWFSSLSTAGAFGCTQPNFTDLLGTISTAQIAASAVTNAKLANMAALTLKGNATASTAAPTDIDITALPSKASPGGTDIVLIQDASASNAFKKTTVSGIGTAAGVSSIDAVTGAFTTGGGVKSTGSVLQRDFTEATQTSVGPANNTSISTSNIMVGDGVTNCRITPVKSGRLHFGIQGNTTTSGGANITLQLRYGTGAGPAAGAAATGSQAGATRVFSVNPATANVDFAFEGVITGFALSTAVWYDIAAVATSGTGSVINQSCGAFEF